MAGAGQGQLTAEQIALIALQDEIAQMRQQVNNTNQRFDLLNASHMALKVAHDTLEQETEKVLRERKAEIEDIGARIKNLLTKQQCDLLDLKSMKPTVFRGLPNEKWRPWARKTKAYCNGKSPGFRAALEWRWWPPFSLIWP